MNLFIMADMEGISGICRSSQVRSDGEHYAQGRTFLTMDVNACIEGCFNGGARRVTVRDAHGCGYHFLWDEVDARARIIQGDSPRERMPGIGSCDGLILLGYHAMGGTAAGILEHTFSSKAWQNLWMNGRRCGEIAVDAAIAGDRGVPTILVTGDDKTCREARKFLKGARTVQVKEGLATEGGILLAREPAHELIRKGAEDAVRNCKSIPPFKVRSPVRLKLELVSRGRVPEPAANRKIVDGRTYEVTADTVEAALKALF
ncbi:MAG: M55 family metallopeptidase [Kiritimatiellia bacterium]|nr:M55 family metallopeptidase [Kiritimatiellia bacterium]